MSVRGSSSNGDPPCGREVIALRQKPKAKKRRNAAKKQGRDNLRRIHHIAAALYWFVRLVLMLIDWFKN